MQLCGICVHIILQGNRTCVPLKTFTLHEQNPLNSFKALEADKYMGMVSPILDK